MISRNRIPNTYIHYTLLSNDWPRHCLVEVTKINFDFFVRVGFGIWTMTRQCIFIHWNVCWAMNKFWVVFFLCTATSMQPYILFIYIWMLWMCFCHLLGMFILFTVIQKKSRIFWEYWSRRVLFVKIITILALILAMWRSCQNIVNYMDFTQNWLTLIVADGCI